MEVTTIEPGSFCWADLSTSDAAAAKSFYAALFGWTSFDSPMGGGMVYTMLQKDGKFVGALYQDDDPSKPSHWSVYVSVTDADAAAAKAGELGATVLAEPFEVTGAGRMAIIQDPTGAIFHVWQATQHQGFNVINEPGSFCWGELSTHDVAGAITFYTSLFGWEAKGDPAQYVEFQVGGKSIGGTIAIQAEWGPVPPNWMPYIAVADCDAAAEQAVGLGATIRVPPTTIPDGIRFSVIQDPQGAVFGIAR